VWDPTDYRPQSGRKPLGTQERRTEIGPHRNVRIIRGKTKSVRTMGKNMERNIDTMLAHG